MLFLEFETFSLQLQVVTLHVLCARAQNPALVSISYSSIYRELFGEVARNTPACGMLRCSGNEEIVRKVARQEMDVFYSTNHKSLTKLHQHTPLLLDFLKSCPRTDSGFIPADTASCHPRIRFFKPHTPTFSLSSTRG